jgi:acyl-CoA oxidase
LLKRLPASSFHTAHHQDNPQQTHLPVRFDHRRRPSPLSPFASSFLEYGYVTNTHLSYMRRRIDGLLEVLLPDVIALADAWSFSEASLASALGCRDGDVYTRLLAWIRQLPINIEAARNDGVSKNGWDEKIWLFLIRDCIAKAKL